MTDGGETCGRHMTTVNLLTTRHKSLEELHPGAEVVEEEEGGTRNKTHPRPEMGLFCSVLAAVPADPNADDPGGVQRRLASDRMQVTHMQAVV